MYQILEYGTLCEHDDVCKRYTKKPAVNGQIGNLGCISEKEWVCNCLVCNAVGILTIRDLFLCFAFKNH